MFRLRQERAEAAWIKMMVTDLENHIPYLVEALSPKSLHHCSTWPLHSCCLLYEADAALDNW